MAWNNLRHIIVRLNLNGVGIPGQSQILSDKASSEFFPIHIRISGQMGVVIADRAIDLAEQRHCHQLRPLPFQSVGDVGHFLAQGGRRGRLTMGAGQHRLSGVLMRQRTSASIKLSHCGNNAWVRASRSISA